MRLVLASSSPRRRALLEAAGLRFDVVPVDVDERLLPGETPDVYVGRLARAKAGAVSAQPDTVVLAADTVVLVDDEVLGKPIDDADARRMLQQLAGRTHVVLSGVVLSANGKSTLDLARTEVRFIPLTPQEIDWYVATGEPGGKAGAYAIQGRASLFVERLEGSYTNVVGLPIEVVYRRLAGLGCSFGELSDVPGRADCGG